MGRFYKNTGGPFGAILALLGFAVGMLALIGAIVGLLSFVGWIGGEGRNDYERESTAFHGLPAELHVLRESPGRIEIADDSPYAREESLTLSRYVSRFYQNQRLMQESEYDPQGSRTYLRTLEYDMAGNVLAEQIADETEGTWTYRHIYEYDDSGQVAHEEVYQDDALIERNYYRYLYASYVYGGADQTLEKKIGYAGVNYSYLNDQVDGGISQYCANHTEYLTDGEDNPLCIFRFNSLLVENPTEVWKLQWQRQGDRLLNRVQNYKAGYSHSSTRDWYLREEKADAEQFNLYECSDKAEKHLVLQINYNHKAKFLLNNSFYLARYSEDRLLWQMDYAEGELDYYSACLYDDEGRLREAVEYDAQGEEPQTFFYRYEYSEADREDQYAYAVQGEAFGLAFGDGDQVRLVFSENGVLSAIEMTNASENRQEIFAFADSGENAGQLRQMCAGTEVAAGEREFLRKLEKEAARYGFRVGEDLADTTERSAE